MVRVSCAISSWKRSQVTRSRKPIRPSARAEKGTKARPIRPSVWSMASICQEAKTSSRTRVRIGIMPPWMKTRAPSRSSMPRVTRSPEWMRSWKPKDRR